METFFAGDFHEVSEGQIPLETAGVEGVNRVWDG